MYIYVIDESSKIMHILILSWKITAAMQYLKIFSTKLSQKINLYNIAKFIFGNMLQVKFLIVSNYCFSLLP